MVELVFDKPEVNIYTANHVEKTILPWEVFFLFGTFVFIVLFKFFNEVFYRTVYFFYFDLYLIIGFVRFEIKILNCNKVVLLKIQPTLCLVLKKIFLMKVEMVNLVSLSVYY